MTRDTQLIIGVVVLAAVGGLAYTQLKSDAKVGTKEEKTANLPDLKTPDDVDTISITNGEKGEVVLVKKGDKWSLSKPVAFLANQQNVKAVLDNLKDLKAEETISSKLTDDQKKIYDLDDKKAVHLVVSKGADKKLDITFGKSGTRGQMATVAGKEGVYSIKGYSSYLYAKEVKAWRDTEIFKFEETNVVSMTIDNKAGPFSFTKGEHWAASFKGKPIERFEEPKVGEALRAFKGLTADDFGDGKTVADTGLDAPEATVTIALKDNAGKYTLKVGKVATGTARYAQKDGSDTVYVIANWPSEWATSEVTKWQSPGDAGTKDGGKGAAPDMEGMPPGMQLPPGMQMPPGMHMPPGHP